ncbi:MAG: hypothetical protein ACR2JO_05605 [Mycobacteriales bacterium]|jgi:hypothetical protein
MRVSDYARISDSKPVYALIGANSALADGIRRLPASLTRLQDDVQEQIRQLPEQVSHYATEIGDKATLLYTELADRGQRLVGSERPQGPPAAAEGDHVS